mmetsp:Transcript_27664/g.64783  ORF Transcript_27664/g.64783 Transcript_27664/m.64783 type:complete len:207 (+) Transcript_27664:805-1425(+)
MSLPPQIVVPVPIHNIERHDRNEHNEIEKIVRVAVPVGIVVGHAGQHDGSFHHFFAAGALVAQRHGGRFDIEMILNEQAATGSIAATAGCGGGRIGTASTRQATSESSKGTRSSDGRVSGCRVVGAIAVGRSGGGGDDRLLVAVVSFLRVFNGVGDCRCRCCILVVGGRFRRRSSSSSSHVSLLLHHVHCLHWNLNQSPTEYSKDY